jgi:hypothetical protein
LILFFLQFFSKINKRTPTFIPESRVKDLGRYLISRYQHICVDAFMIFSILIDWFSHSLSLSLFRHFAKLMKYFIENWLYATLNFFNPLCLAMPVDIWDTGESVAKAACWIKKDGSQSLPPGLSKCYRKQTRFPTLWGANCQTNKQV